MRFRIRERVFGLENSDTAATYHNIAWVYAEQVDYEKALEYYKKAYVVQLSKLGGNHPNTIDPKDSTEIVEFRMKYKLLLLEEKK